jgi:hypothetical protein
MAKRDRSQGHGFVYVNVAKLLKQVDEIKRRPEIHPQERDAYSVHFPKLEDQDDNAINNR